jgi:hypothetical protein
MNFTGRNFEISKNSAAFKARESPAGHLGNVCVHTTSPRLASGGNDGLGANPETADLELSFCSAPIPAVRATTIECWIRP